MSRSAQGRWQRVAPNLALLVLLPLLLWLGDWQLDRAEQKRGLVAAHAAAAATPPTPYAAALARFTRVAAAGRWDDAHQFLLDAAVHEGQVGYRVLTPLLLADGRWLIVDRGWVPGDPARRAPPTIALQSETAAVTGLIDDFPRAGIALASADPVRDAPWPRVVLYPAVEALADALGHPVEPVLIRLDPAAADGYARGFAPDFGVSRARHLGYAATWFLLALTLVVLWLRAMFRMRGER